MGEETVETWVESLVVVTVVMMGAWKAVDLVYWLADRMVEQMVDRLVD